MIRFREFQLGWVLIVVVGFVVILITILFTLQLGTRPISPLHYPLILFGMIIPVLFMYGMRTEVTKVDVSVTFGIGIIVKRFPLESVASVGVVTNPWFYGWGIRIIPNGWLYNMGGHRAVELQMKSGRVVRIGSRKPEELEAILKETIARRS